MTTRPTLADFIDAIDPADCEPIVAVQAIGLNSGAVDDTVYIRFIEDEK